MYLHSASSRSCRQPAAAELWQAAAPALPLAALDLGIVPITVQAYSTETYGKIASPLFTWFLSSD